MNTTKIRKTANQLNAFLIENPFLQWIFVGFSILLWNIAIFFSNSDFANWGLFNGLHFSYYLGLLICIINLSLSLFVYKKKFHIFINILILFAYYFAPSFFITRNARIFSAFKYIGHWEYLDRIGTLDLWYHSWPGSFFLFGLLTSQITNPSKYMVAQTIYPFIFRIVFTLFLMVIIENILRITTKNSTERKKYSVVITLLFITFYDWISQDFVNGQSVAYIIFLAGFGILCDFYRKIQEEELSRKQLFTESLKTSSFIALYLVALVFTHLYTSIIFFVTVFIFIMFYLNKLRKHFAENKKARLYIYIGILSVVAIACILFFTNSWVISRISDFFSGVTDIKPYALILMFQNIISGNTTRIFIIVIRLVLSAVFFVLIAISLYRNYKEKKKLSYPILSLLLALVICFFAFLFIYASDELIQRTYYFALPIVIFSVLSFIKRVNIKNFFLLVLIFSSMFLISRYGNEEVDFISDGEFRLIDFIENNYQDKTIIMSNLELLRGKNYEIYHTIKLSNVDFNGTHYVYTNDSVTPVFSNHIVVFSREYYYRQTIFQNEKNPYAILGLLLNSSYYTLVYNENLNYVLEHKN